MAFLTIYIRSVFRCVELADGFHSELANDEKAFMILEGAMIGVAAIALSAFHPGIIFGHYWSKCNFSFSGKNDAYITTKEVQDSSMSLNAYPNHV